MQVIHPQGMVQNLPPENVFIAVDDMGTELGMGYIIYQYQPHLYPDCPINLYFSMECQSVARYLLFGALVARARQLRDANRDVRARVYTNISPTDTRLKDFFEHNGFTCDETEDLLTLQIPQGDGRIPMSCTVAVVPLNTPEEQAAFITRLQQNDLTYMNQDYLASLQQQPHFLALGLYHNTDLIGEIVLAGAGDSCDLVAIYIIPAARQQGMGRALLHRSMAIMAAEGVSTVTTRVMSRSIPQARLMADFGAQVQGVTTIYPGLFL